MDTATRYWKKESETYKRKYILSLTINFLILIMVGLWIVI